MRGLFMLLGTLSRRHLRGDGKYLNTVPPAKINFPLPSVLAHYPEQIVHP
jgi:hypothetical protein